MQRIIDDAKANGYAVVESYPVIRDEEYEWDCAGPIHLYEKIGFVKVAEQKNNIVMRKELKSEVKK